MWRVALGLVVVAGAGGSADATPRARTPELRPAAVVARPRGANPAALAKIVARGWRASGVVEGVPRWLFGATIEASGASADPAIAERAARQFLAEHAALIAPGTADADWELVTNQVDVDLRTVGFRQRWHGLAVVGGQLAFVFGKDRLFAVASSARPDIDAGDPRARRARPDAAIAWLTGEVGPLAATAAGDRVVFDNRIADVITLDHWTLYVATNGTPIAARDTRRYDTLMYDAPVQWPGGARMAYPADTVFATVNGQPQTSGVNGTLINVIDTPATVIPSVTGTYVQVTSGTPPPATGSLTLPIGGSVTWSRATVPNEDAELASYVHVMQGKAAARRIVPALASWLDQQLPVFVDQPGACNAFSSGDDLHFFVASATCENTGRLADVVFHELGHSVHNQGVIAGAGAFEAALSEGLADYFATTISGDPGIGRGFDFTGTPLRDDDPPGRDLRYPEDASDDPHVPGMIVAGALWDLQELAGQPVAETALRGLIQRAHDLPSAYVAALIADDDDANLGNGTPHGCAIGEAFARHGLAPDFATTSVGLPTVEGATISVPIAIPTNTACPAPTVATVTLRWRSTDAAGQPIGGEVAMTTSDGARYRGAIPTTLGGPHYDYSIEVALSTVTTIRLPSNLADPEYQIVLGAPPVVLYCATMDADPGWTQTAGWQFGAPTAAGADPSTAFTGTSVLGTNLHANGDYVNHARELATLPTIDTRGYPSVHLQFRRWLTVEDALYDQATITANGATVWTNAKHGGTLNHFDREWRFVDLDLSAHVVDDQLSVGFALTSDSQGISGGWTLDDVCLVARGEPPQADGATGNDGGGCCGTSRPTGELALGLGVLASVRRRRRR